jgi:flagellar basal body rod protein FlgG
MRKRYKMKKIFIILFLLSQYIFPQESLNDISLTEKYFLLLTDLLNANTNGYKSHLLDINIEKKQIYEERIGKNINFSQGALKFTNSELDFAINGRGFFKILLKDGNIAYTRNGEFTIDKETNEIITMDGYRLFDSIKIKPGFTRLIIDNEHLITTLYENGEEMNNGYLNIYAIDTEKLEYSDYYIGIRKIFLYCGNEEIISDDRIYNKIIECSNVSTADTIVQLITVCRLLGMKFEEMNEENIE